MRRDAPRSGGRLSIGALARATGVPVETLRTWESRYGYPVPERKPSGHRVYPLSSVPRLRRIAQALARGHRAGEVVPASEADLAALLSTTAPPAAPEPVGPVDVPTIQTHLDGSATELFAVDPAEATLLAVLRELFEEHWGDVIFGPCVEGAVFEGRFAARPTLSLLDGYLTVELADREAWHFHLCIGPHRGSASRPTPDELARWRRCARAAFFRDSDPDGRHAAWGFRMWNGRGEQMLTVFLPTPWLDEARRRFVATPRWDRLALWMGLRARYAGVHPEPPPADPCPPRTH